MTNRCTGTITKKRLANHGCAGHKSDMKARIVSALLILLTAGFVFAQAEKVKGKARDLKKDIEQKQTNKVDKPTTPPPKK
jgi:hypothetical protein